VDGTSAGMWVEPRCRQMPGQRLGPFVRLADGRLLTFGDNVTWTSADEGATWSEGPAMCSARGPGRPVAEGLALRTRRGTVLYVYMDRSSFRWSWDETRKEAGRDVRSDVWVIRGEDDGRRWRGRRRIFRGYCGALIDMIQTSAGWLVVPVQRLLRDPCRHAICVYVSRLARRRPHLDPQQHHRPGRTRPPRGHDGADAGGAARRAAMDAHPHEPGQVLGGVFRRRRPLVAHHPPLVHRRAWPAAASRWRGTGSIRPAATATPAGGATAT